MAFYKCVVGHCLNNHFYNVFSVTAHCLCLMFGFNFNSSHAAVWRSTSATTSVSIRSSLLLDSFYIALDKHLLPCQANCFLGAFDKLLKAHFVFSLSYDDDVYTFLHFYEHLHAFRVLRSEERCIIKMSD